MEYAVQVIKVLRNLIHVETSASCPKTAFCALKKLLKMTPKVWICPTPDIDRRTPFHKISSATDFVMPLNQDSSTGYIK